MRAETKEGLLLVVKSVLVLVGVLLCAAASVDLVVRGVTVTGVAYLAAGLVLAGAPLAVAFRDALRAGRSGNGG